MIIIMIANIAILKTKQTGIHKGDVTHHQDQVDTTPTSPNFNPKNKRNIKNGALIALLPLDFAIVSFLFYTDFF